MGVYDEVICEYPLPDGWQPPGAFQTYDTPAQALDVYTLRADGTLWHPTEGQVLYHGALTLYTNNLSGSSNAGVITSDDQPPWEAEYVALFDHGVLRKVEGRWRLTPEHHQVTREAFFAR